MPGACQGTSQLARAISVWLGLADQNACSGAAERQAGRRGAGLTSSLVAWYTVSGRTVKQRAEGGQSVKLVVYAGAVWGHCAPTEVERLDVASVDEAVEKLVEWLDWLSPVEAERIALACLEGDDCVLAGYANELLELRAEPPEGAEPLDRNRYGDTVYVVGEGQYWEPFYVCASILDDEG